MDKEKYEMEIKILKSDLLVSRRELNRIKKYLENIPAIVVVLENLGNVDYINLYGAGVLGFNESKEIIGLNWFDNFIPESVRDNVKFVFEKIMSGEILPVEFYRNPVITRFGTTKDIFWRNKYLTDEKGEITHTLSIGHDEIWIKNFTKFFGFSRE